MDGNLLNQVSLQSRSFGLRPALPSGTNQVSPSAKTFADVLAKAKGQGDSLKFSSHAKTRLQQRGMVLTHADVAKLQQAVDKAGQKGSKDVYVVYGDAGFVVNVPNRTVVTAMMHREEPVITNIDSVVVLAGPDQ